MRLVYLSVMAQAKRESRPSLAAWSSKRLPTVLLRRMKESCVPPGHRATTFNSTHFVQLISDAFTEWKFFPIYVHKWISRWRLHMCVHSMALVTPGMFEMELHPCITSTCLCASWGSLKYCGINLIMPLSTAGRMRLIDGWEIPDLSPISRWKSPCG